MSVFKNISGHTLKVHLEGPEQPATLVEPGGLLFLDNAKDYVVGTSIGAHQVEKVNMADLPTHGPGGEPGPGDMAAQLAAMTDEQRAKMAEQAKMVLALVGSVPTAAPVVSVEAPAVSEGTDTQADTTKAPAGAPAAPTGPGVDAGTDDKAKTEAAKAKAGRSK